MNGWGSGSTPRLPMGQKPPAAQGPGSQSLPCGRLCAGAAVNGIAHALSGAHSRSRSLRTARCGRRFGPWRPLGRVWGRSLRWPVRVLPMVHDARFDPGAPFARGRADLKAWRRAPGARPHAVRLPVARFDLLHCARRRLRTSDNTGFTLCGAGAPLAARAVEGAAWERRGPACAALTVGSGTS